MARPQLRDQTSAQPVFSGQPRKLYWVERQEDVWFIRFDGADYGPYKSDREALLFLDLWAGPVSTAALSPGQSRTNSRKTCHRPGLWAMTVVDAH
jgi:hypothetical protein